MRRLRNRPRAVGSQGERAAPRPPLESSATWVRHRRYSWRHPGLRRHSASCDLHPRYVQGTLVGIGDCTSRPRNCARLTRRDVQQGTAGGNAAYSASNCCPPSASTETPPVASARGNCVLVEQQTKRYSRPARQSGAPAQKSGKQGRQREKLIIPIDTLSRQVLQE